LRSQGRLAEAAQAFREGIAAQPGLPLLHANLATTLVENGDLHGAQREYEVALACDPHEKAALSGLGSLHVRLGRFTDARRAFEAVLASDPNDMAANQSMYELEQIDGNIPKALAHQRRVLERKTLFSQFAPQEQRRLLALLVPGDWQANVPVDFLVDSRTTTLHKLYLLSPEQAGSVPLPQADVVFTAIGESDESIEGLHVASALIRRIGLPYINDPQKVLRTNRVRAARALGEIPDVYMPPTERMQREALEHGGVPIAYPLLARPVGSQAGRDLARIADTEELDAYLRRVAASAFFVMPFVDYKKQDGYYRKYRIVVVDGVPYPYHLAISPNWMIHYYNAPMRETPWMRDEEAVFLERFEHVFGPPLQRALREIARVLGLEYFGVDCSIDSQGRLLVFEADPAMVVHAGDDPQIFPYKIAPAQRIFNAFQRLIDRVGSR
jgi:tetratricopeptide (TPR) repeat protein